MIWTFCPLKCFKSFKLEVKQPTYYYNSCYISWTSFPVTIRPIHSSQVSTIICTLGWNDEVSPLPKVEDDDSTWNVEQLWNVLTPLHHKTPSQHLNLLFDMQNDPIITKDVPPPPLHWHKCPKCGCNKKNKNKGRWGKLGKPCMFSQTQIKCLSEVVKIHDLPQYMPTSSLWKMRHSFGVDGKAHSPFIPLH